MAEGSGALVQALNTGDLRRDDAFVRAVVDYFQRFAAGCTLPRPIEGYLAGGLGVRCYAGARATGDMFFPGARVLIPPDTVLLVRNDGREHAPIFDHQYTPDFGLLHPDYAKRAVDLAQHLRGQTEAEAVELAGLRAGPGGLAAETFWPGEWPLPPGTDPVAERWGYTRGIDTARLARALRQEPLDLLPERT
ncbi:hypothetical protein [Benzoatithermus flavus]|uniref:Uncharacterized protein n=1 Tax=Benzoatithermus flavus TaxID=3108223 RepID=A0ABU8XUB8_9PROT